jgi:N,N'-diacetylchitobiose phosphorylase
MAYRNCRLVTKYILGIRPSYKGLEIDPCIPSDWKAFDVIRKWRGATYNIKVQNPDGIEKGVKSISLNGKDIKGVIPIQKKGTVNEIVVMMGK